MSAALGTPPPRVLSPAAALASLSPEEREARLSALSLDTRAHLAYSWRFWGRPDQQMPDDDWFVWLILAGRGWGKTRTAVENIAAMLRGPTPLIAPDDAPGIMSIVADTPFDMRQYTVEGPSGFLSVGPPEWRPLHEPSKRTLTWPNGCRALLFSAEDPETLRGASGSFFWWDELAKSPKAQQGWDNLMFGMREGRPRGIVTTTPRPVPILRDLMGRPSTHVTRGSTWDNRDNLSATYYREVIAPKIGTRLGRQEIEAEILDDVQGALWTRAMIDQCQHSSVLTARELAPRMRRIVVAVDPSGTRGEEDSGDEIGIVAAGVGDDDVAHVLEDATCKLSPDGWGRRVVDVYRRWGADRVVAERNFGGAMVEHVIRTVDASVPYGEVVASRGKHLRAEPVAALYEQGRVRHVLGLSALEDQLCSMGADGYVGRGSPDRLDALVWAVTELLLTEDVPRAFSMPMRS